MRRPSRVTEYFVWPFLSAPFERKIPFDLDRLSNSTSESVSESDRDVPRVVTTMRIVIERRRNRKKRNLRDGISSSCVPSRAYFCGFVRVLGFLVRRHMHVSPQQQPDMDRKPRNTPMTTYRMDQSTNEFTI